MEDGVSEEEVFVISLRISAKQSRKQTDGGGGYRKSRLRVQKSPPGNGFRSEENPRSSGGKGI